MERGANVDAPGEAPRLRQGQEDLNPETSIRVNEEEFLCRFNVSDARKQSERAISGGRKKGGHVSTSGPHLREHWVKCGQRD